MGQTEKYSKEEARSLKIGLGALAVFFAMGALFLWTSRRFQSVEDGGNYTVFAGFGRTDGLLAGDKVRMAGIDVGRVMDAEFTGSHFRAELTLEISDKVKIPDDSSAAIVSTGLMGPKYIEIEPGGSEDFLPEGGRFAYTQDAMVIEELIERIISIGKANREKEKK